LREGITVAKKVLPIHLDAKERQVLERLSERDGISMAEVVRRAIRNLALEIIPSKALERASGDNAH
jgi:hypothetical protein